ncbi:PREDICTED: uncharacterized protein LOC109178739 [Ipomoea nil]|uniref:uncharacterized protein LOC109178739 n=1 Tax=Ipomoea nil TaxID=35883 RepID=UPI000901CE2C|nr:PREDICTED: uncharacterized protein LOC109178739 [Ipomoea nil]
MEGAIHGCRVARGAPPVSHLFFVDDSLLFFKANIQEAGIVKQCLLRYEKLSGQKVEIRGEVAACLEVEQAANFGKYLGLPYFVGRNKRAAFSYVGDKIRQRIGSWNKKLLSQAGIGGELDQKGEYIGRLGIRYASLKSMVAWAWRFLTNPSTLATKIYKARNYPNTSFIDATIGNCPSFCWSSIMAAHGMELRNAHAAGLIDQQTNTWDPHILFDLFIPEDVARISMIPVSPDYEDMWFWKGESNGVYTVKNAYRQIKGDFEHNPCAFDKWVTLCKLKVPPKWKTFLWRAICDIIPTTDNLIVKRVEVDLACPMFGITHESAMHALILCDYSKIIWNISGLHVTNVVTHSLSAWLMGILNILTEEQCGLAIAVLYNIWNARNTAVWEHDLPRPHQVWRHAAAAMHVYRQTHRPSPRAPVFVAATTDGCETPRCYADAGYRPATGEATYGAVLLSHQGTFVAVTSGKLSGAFSAVMAEALACKEALSWLKDRDIRMMDLLTDCSELRNELYSSPTANLSYIGIIVDKYRTTISLFTRCSLSYVSRTLNFHAHTLASLDFDQEQPMYWDSVPPDSIAQFIH